MRIIVITLYFVSLTLCAFTQNIDSILSVPQTLELNISTPQPRLKEKFQISLDINYVRAHIFKSAFGNIQLAGEIGNTEADLMTLNINALKKGKNEIGPLQFTLNGTQYSTNKIEYEVIDPLPNTDNGLWIRKVFTSDSTFCIIIEQRIPANRRVTEISEKETKYWTDPVSDNLAKFKFTYSVDGLQGGTAASYSDFGSIYDTKRQQKNFMSGYSITYFTIVDKKKRIIITEDKFENIPADYKFEDIVIQ
jgi:hypothetical protein